MKLHEGDSRQKRYGGTVLLINALAISVLLLVDCELGWATLILTWLNMLMFSILASRKAVFLSGFLVAFGVLLLSRGILWTIFGYGEGIEEASRSQTTVLILEVGLVAVGLGYQFALILGGGVGRRVTHRDFLAGLSRETATQSNLNNGRFFSAVSDSCRLLVMLIAPALMAILAVVIAESGLSGYQSSYTAEGLDSAEGGMRLLASYLRDAMMVAYSIFLATMPTRKRFLEMLAPVMVVQVMYLFTGVRREFALFLIILVCYVVVRHRAVDGESWIPRHGAIWVSASAGAIVVLFTVMESLRGVGSSSSMLSFFYNQGVSIRVIDNVVLYGALLPPQNYLLAFAHTGLLARLFGLPILQGNTIERALHGDSLSHALSLIVMGEQQYTSGLSFGSCSLAEGYIQWGMVGVVLVGVVTGILLRFIEGIQRGHFAANVVRMLIAAPVVWSARGSAGGFLQTLFAPVTLAVVAVVLLIAAAYLRIQGQFEDRGGSLGADAGSVRGKGCLRG